MFANVGEFASREVTSYQTRIAEGEQRVLTLKVSHERLCSAVQSVDDHLPVCRTSDLYPPILEAGSRRGAYPRRVSANVCGLGVEVERNACIEPLLRDSACDEQALASGLESPVESGEELEGVLGEYLGLSLLSLFGKDLYAGDHGCVCSVASIWDGGGGREC